MIKKVLIVDDDQEMLLSLKEGLEKYDETFSVMMAGDGVIALDKLKKNTISLVVTDLKMPRMDGFTLLAHIMESYPDIPVVIITGYSTPEMEELAREGGAVGYIEKPFMIEDLARKIITTLRKESEGGTLHSVSSAMFLQLIEMEQKTCTIRLTDRFSGKHGVLFFRDGEVLDARVDGLQGEAAAYEIFCWDEVSLSIQNECPQKEKKIMSELQGILLEAMRLKDEANQLETAAMARTEAETDKKVLQEGDGERVDFIQNVKNRLKTEIGEKCGLEDIYQESSWIAFVAKAAQAGSVFNAGNLKLGYIDRGERNDFIIIPSEPATVISVNPKCPRDRIMEVIGG